MIYAKKLIAYILTFLMIFSVFPLSIQAQEKVIVINPGHSVGYDSGAVANDVTEAEVNEALAGRLVKVLRAKGYKVYITHTTDESLSEQKLLTQTEGNELKTVLKAINTLDPDLTISIHHNSGGIDSTGAEIYWSSYRDFDTSGVYTVSGLWSSGELAYRDKTPSKAALNSSEFAQILKEHLSDSSIGVRNIIERDDYIPAHTTSASVLYEGGFLTNPKEAAYIASDAYIADAVERITSAVNEYFGIADTDEDISTVDEITVDTPIIGDTNITKEMLVTFYNTNAGISFPEYYGKRGVTLENFVQIYIDEAQIENVRADLAFAQAMLETGYLKFGNDVDISQFNFVGLGAVGGGEAGENFAALYGDNITGIRMGIRAHIQHLKAYGSIESLNQECVDPRFDYVQRGSAKTIKDLTGKWSVDPDYATKIVNLMNKINFEVEDSESNDNSNTIIGDGNENNTGNTSPSIEKVAIYRLFNSITSEHLFTSDAIEAQILSTQHGWIDEGISWYAPISGTPVYRLYNSVIGSHLYTIDLNEIAILTNQFGWSVDNNGAPLFYSGGNNSIYRLYNETLQQHHLTTNLDEYNTLPQSGWSQEGVALYCV